MKKAFLNVAAGAGGCFLVLSGYWWASAQYLQKQADNMPSGCQAHYTSRAVNGWPWRARLDTQNMRMVCTPLLAARYFCFSDHLRCGARYGRYRVLAALFHTCAAD